MTLVLAAAPDEARFDYTAAQLQSLWPRLHALDGYAFPDAATLQSRWQAHYPENTDWHALSEQLVEAWRTFHNGHFDAAHQAGCDAGQAGGYVANLAVNSHGAYQLDTPQREAFFAEAVNASGANLVSDQLEDHYVHALNLGRYADSLPAARAVSSGTLLQFKRGIEHCLALAPDHIPSLLTYAALMAEVIATLGEMTARLTFATNSKKVLGYYHQAGALSDPPPVVFLEHAKGLEKLNAKRYRQDITDLLERAIRAPVLDTLDRLDQHEATQRLAMY